MRIFTLFKRFIELYIYTFSALYSMLFFFFLCTINPIFFYRYTLLFYFYLFILLFIIFGCVGSSFPCKGFLQLRRAGATLHRGAQVSHCRGLSRCRAQAPDAQAQQLWLTGLAALRHVGSSRTGARTRVPCIGRRIPNTAPPGKPTVCYSSMEKKILFLL